MLPPARMLRFLFWVLLISVTVLFLNGTLPTPGIADEEVVYDTPPPIASCTATGCIAIYSLDVGNVGRSPQKAVRVRLRAGAIDDAVIVPTIRRAMTNAAVAPEVDERSGVVVLPVGTLDPEERVTVVFALHATARDAVKGWDRVLVGVEPSAGAGRPGDAGELTMGRVVHAAGRVVIQLTDVARKAIAKTSDSASGQHPDPRAQQHAEQR
jgi:hypothetical protein